MANNQPLEAARVRRGHALLKKRGAWFLKTTGVHLVGCPDTLVCYRGYFIGIEWKQSANAKRRSAQYAQLAKIAKAGGVGIFCWDNDRLIETLDKIDAHDRAKRAS